MGLGTHTTYITDPGRLHVNDETAVLQKYESFRGGLKQEQTTYKYQYINNTSCLAFHWHT